MFLLASQICPGRGMDAFDDALLSFTFSATARFTGALLVGSGVDPLMGCTVPSKAFPGTRSAMVED
jgi:hypothetical protein